MTYKMTLVGLGLGAVLLTGCGSNSDGGFIEPETTAQAQTSIVGDWTKACYYDEEDDQSYLDDLTMKADKTFTYRGKAYPTENCTGDSVHSEEMNGTYKIGKLTEGSDGKPAFEFDVLSPGVDNQYFMVRFTSTELVFSDEKDDGSEPDGKTPATRNNYFDPKTNDIWTRK